MAKRNYVNNRQLNDTMKVYHAQVQEAIANGTEKPRVPNYVGECLQLIATKLSNKPQYYMYTFKQEMIYEGVLNCLQYIDNYNPNRYDNPFAYFTQIIKNAFLRRIEKESYIRYNQYKMRLAQMSYSEMKRADQMIAFVENYELYERKKLEKAKKKDKLSSNNVVAFFTKKETV
jgi:hypothetical protein